MSCSVGIIVGRFKCNPIETHGYLLACCRYVECNPVRARVVSKPQEYCRSGYRGKVGLAQDAVIDRDSCYQALGHDDIARRTAYAHWVCRGGEEIDVKLIRAALSRGQLTGTARFMDEVEDRIGLRIQTRGPGRPKNGALRESRNEK